MGSLSGGKWARMSIPKSESDLDKLVQEVESREGEHPHEGAEHEEELVDTTSLLAEAVHMLSHFEGHLSELASSVRGLNERLQNIERLLGVLAKVLLLQNIKERELRDKLIEEIVESLEA